MKKLALLILVLALPSLADAPKRNKYPDDYKPSPCAPPAAALCETFTKERIADHGGDFRGFNIKQEWVNAHWDEMRQSFMPLCEKIANCITVKGNDWVFCTELLGKEFIATCERFPAGSEDRKQCGEFATIYFMGMVAKKESDEAKACAAALPAPAAPGKLEAWIDAPAFTPDFNGRFVAYAIDAETHLPVRAYITIDAGMAKNNRGPKSITGYAMGWKAGFKAVPNEQGHRNVVPPAATFTAPGYEPLTIPIEMEVPQLTVIMTPPSKSLKRGMNTITVETYDAVTNKPVEMRVMAGDRVLGKANTPLLFEWKEGEKRPEIWVTSLWNRYSDVVIAPAE
jgi:hypothetical protein